MSAWILAPSGLFEPVPAPEIYVDGIGAIETIGSGNVRVHLIQEQMPLEIAAGAPQKIVVAKIIGPVMNIPGVIGQLAQCLWRQTTVMPYHGPRLVE